MNSQVVSGLEVSSMDDNSFLELPNTYSSKEILAREQNNPLQEEVDKWPHLSQVKIPKIQSEEGLLIGTDIPKTMEVWQVVPSIEDGPYAVKIRLGWIVNGPLRGENDHDTTSGLIQAASNRTSVATLDELWSYQQFKIDFPECQDDRLEMSGEHIQLMELISQSAKQMVTTASVFH